MATEFTTEDLKRLDAHLQSIADEKYRQFHGKLIPGVDSIFYGVRVPELRKLAKQLIKGDWRSFVEMVRTSRVYEMNMLCGMVTALAKCDFKEKLSYVRQFIPCINNWAVCDIVCGDMKEVKENREAMFEFIQPYLVSEEEYEVRFAVVILMQYFLTDKYIYDVLKIYDGIRHEGYYVKMAVAWGISLCFIKYREETFSYLVSCNLDDFTYNKSIQKMIESFRVSSQDKQILRGMKRPAAQSVRKGERNET